MPGAVRRCSWPDGWGCLAMAGAFLGVLAAGGFEVHLLGEGGEQAGLPFGLAGEERCASFAGEVEDGPEFHEPVEPVQAQQVLFPAGSEGGGEVPVAGPVDLLDPGTQPHAGFLTVRAAEFPPPRGGHGLVRLAVLVDALDGRHARELGGEGGDLLVETVEGLKEGCLSGAMSRMLSRRSLVLASWPTISARRVAI